jgi:hypothetical protein
VHPEGKYVVDINKDIDVAVLKVGLNPKSISLDP